MAKCYAMKAYRQHENVRRAWDGNQRYLTKGAATFYEIVAAYIEKKRPARFRWNVGGDFTTSEQALQVVELARRFPTTHFHCPTKKPHLFPSQGPGNLILFQSRWPGDKDPGTGFRNAWYQDETEARVPRDAFTCTGDCRVCHFCYSKGTSDVVYKAH